MAKKDDAPDLTADEKFEMLLDLLTQQAKTQQPLTPATLSEILKETSVISAQTMHKALRPENETHPGISAFSYPEGDVARPRTVLPFEFLYNGYPCHMFPETEHWRELELMAAVQPGEFTVLRKDGSKMAVSVTAERDADLKITKLSVQFPISREDKPLIPPKAVVLYQLVHSDNPRKRFVEAMQEHLAMIMGAEPIGA